MEFILVLLPLILELLPLILNKPENQQKTAFLRRVVFFNKLANSEGDLSVRMAAGEMAEIFACLAEADQAGREDIVAGLVRANDAAQAAAREV